MFYFLKNKNTNKAFTLIELLVVVAIIGVLASVVLASLNTARAKGRDSRRMSDLRQINLAIQMYYDNHGSFPVCGSHTIDNGLTECLAVALIADNVISRLPVDPLYGNNGAAIWGYDYEYSSTGTRYWIRSGFEGTPLQQNGDYPNGTTCDSGIYPTCGWYQSCVSRGYGVGTCPLSQTFGE